MPKPNLSEIQAAKNSVVGNFKISDRQTIAVTDLISEGPIYGLVDSQASVFLNDDRAAPLAQAASFRSSTGQRVVLTNGSTTATITGGGSSPFTVPSNGDKFLIVRAGSGTQTVVASNSSGGSSNANVVTTLTTSGGASFFTDNMVSATTATPEDYVPFRLNRTSSSHGVTDEGAGEGFITTKTSNTEAEFVPGLGGPAGIWLPEGTYEAEVDKVVKIASISGATVTLSAAWSGTSGTYKFDVSGAIVSDADTVTQTQITNYEGVTTQFRTGTLSQAPFSGEGGEGSTAITNTPSAGGSIEQSNNFSGSQAPKELVGSAASGFNLSASQLQEVDEARVTFAYGSGFYAVSGKGKNFPTYIRYKLQIAIKKVGAADFSTPILVSPTGHKVHSGMNTNAVTFVEVFDLTKYRPFSDFKIIIDRVDSHQNPGFKNVGETFHDWQNVTAASISNTTCIIKDILTHPYSAMAKVSFSTKQFQSLPTRGYHVRGLKVQVPSNYITREEASDGIASYKRNVTTGAEENSYQDWDGAFRLNKVYTNNPAWVFYDILVNNRYGLGDFLKATDIDKFALFRIARYCDELVSDGKGGQEPRFTANLYLTKQADAYKVVKDMATIFRGLIYYIDGQLFSSMDAPAGPVYNFSRANVLEGKFSYEGTGSKTRVNQVIVNWINPDANFKAEPLIVEDRLDIVKQNKVLTQTSVAMGATSEGQALRYGRWKLWTAANQKEIVNFSTALNASFLVPGDIINIQDSARNSVRYSGRVSNTGSRTTTSIPIDSSVTINGSNTYELSILFVTPGAFVTSDVTIDGVAYQKGDLITQAFIDSNGDGTYTLQDINSESDAANAKAAANSTDALILKYTDTTRVERRTLTNSAGATTTLTVSSAFSAAPAAEAIWALIETSTEGTLATSAKEYKILSISESTKNTFDISAVEHYNEKFAAVDEDFTTYVADTVYPTVTSTDTVPPVQSVFATNQMTNIALGEVLTLHWIAPTEVGEITGVYEHLAGFEIVHPFLDRENPIRIMEPETTSHSFKDLPIGTYKIAVRTVNVLDNVSEPEIITITISDKFDEPIPRSQKGIPYTGDCNAGMQMSNSGSFSFKNSTYTFKHPSTKAKDIVGDSGESDSFTQDCSGMVATSNLTPNDAGEFLTDHYYLLLDSSESADKIKLLRYHKPNGVGTSYFYDSIDGSSTTRFGSALSGTFTKAANASKVTGSSTSFTSEIAQGDVLKLGTEEIEVSAVESNTVLYLAKATETAHSGVQGFIPNIRIDYINDCIIARAFKKSSDNSFNFVPYAKTDGEVKNAPDVIADGTVATTQIADDAINADKVAGADSTFTTLVNDTATAAGNLNTSLLNAGIIMSRDIRVGPSQSGAAEITRNVATSAMGAGDKFVITNLGSIGNSAWSGLANTTTDTTDSAYRNYAVGDILTIVNANGSLGSGTGAKIAGDGSHLTSNGDFLLGKVSSDKFLFFSSVSGELTLSAPSIKIDQIQSSDFNLRTKDNRNMIKAQRSTGAVTLYHNDAAVVKTDAGGLIIEAGMNLTGADSGHFVTRSVRAKDSNGLSLRTDDSQARIFIKDDGTVGIGTTAPAYPLHVYNTGAKTVVIERGSASNAASLNEFSTHHALAILNRTSGSYLMFSGNSVRTDIQATDGAGTATAKNIHLNPHGGSVGIGTGQTAPDNKVNIQVSALSGRSASNGNTSLTLEHATDTGIQFFSATQTQLRFGDAADTGSGAIIYTHADNILRLSAASAHKFTIGGTEVARIDSSGNLGIGTTAPDGKLSVTSSTINSEDIVYLKSGADNVNDYLGIAWELGVGGNGPHGAIRVAGGPSASDARLGLFTTSDGGSTLTEGLSVAHNGNVGIGTTSPSFTLDVNSGTTNTVASFTSTDAGAGINLTDNSGTSTLQTNGANLRIGVDEDGAVSSSAIQFRVDGSTKAILNSSGSFLIGGTSAGAADAITLNSNGSAVFDRAGGDVLTLRRNTSDGRVVAILDDDEDIVGSISISSSTTSYNTSSDYRLKEDIKPILNATDKVLSLKPINFKWKKSSNKLDGFLAHEVQDILPYAVIGEKDGVEMQSIDHSKLIPILVKTIQELEARIAVLEG